MSEENKAANGAAGAKESQGPQFAIQRVYLKDLSFESPQGAMIFTKQGQPKVNQDMNTAVNKLDEGVFEVVLKITVEVKVEDSTAFLVEVQQAGIFVVTGLDSQQLRQVLNTTCPQMLFPYAREVVDNAAVKGGFPPVAMPPINFDVLFAQALKQAKEQQQNQEASA